MWLSFCFRLFGEEQSLFCREQGILGVLGECRWFIPMHPMLDGCSSQTDARLLARQSITSSNGAPSSRSPLWLGQLVRPHGNTQNCTRQLALVSFTWGWKCLWARLFDRAWGDGKRTSMARHRARWWPGRWRMLRKHFQSWSLVCCLKPSRRLFWALSVSSLDAAVFVQWEGSVKMPVQLGSLNCGNCSVYTFILPAGFK